jgi:hypothetical protein
VGAPKELLLILVVGASDWPITQKKKKKNTILDTFKINLL